jgi:membrane protein involved in colicin uptake
MLGIAGLCALAVACGSGEEPSTGAPAASKTPPAETAQEMSADAQRCLDLVKSKQYAEAIDPCERALREAANADVQRAYDQAKAEVEQAATSAAEEAASGALRDLGGE